MNWYKKAQAGGAPPPPPPPPPPPGLPPLGGPPGGGAPSPSESRVGTIGAVHKGRLKGGKDFDKDVIAWLNKTFKDFYHESGEINDANDPDSQEDSARMKSAKIRTVQLARAAPPDGIGLDIGGPNCLSIATAYDEEHPDKEPPFVRGILCPESASSGAGGAAPAGPPGAPPGPPPPPM